MAKTFDIGLDLDGVAYDFISALRNYVNFTYGTPREVMPNPTCWDFFWEDWGIPFADFKRMTDEGVDAGWIFIQGEPMDHARWAIDRLWSKGHRLHIVTSRDFGTMSVSNTMWWLERWEIPHTSITFTRNKAEVKTDFFLDDLPKNVMEVASTGSRAFLFETPGHTEQERSGIPRVNWGDFMYHVEEAAASD